jgi:hypothetical protein
LFALELHKNQKTAKIAELFFKLPSTQPPFLSPAIWKAMEAH